MATHFSGPVTSTAGFVGAVTGAITGNVTGNVTGNQTGLLYDAAAPNGLQWRGCRIQSNQPGRLRLPL